MSAHSPLRMRGVRAAFSDGRVVLDELNLDFPTGFTGVIGENGAGKTTLLKLLDGRLQPDAGHIFRPPTIAVCTQDVLALPPDVERFAASDEAEARGLRARLRVDDDVVARWSSLSLGERRRAQLGAALWQTPDALLLDEPTNHLDASARALLLEALLSFAGIGVVVSHDATLLDALTTRTVRVQRGTASILELPYSAAFAEWSRIAAAEARVAAGLVREASAAKARLIEARATRAQAEQSRSTKNRMRNKGDNEQRSLMAQYRADSAEKRLAHDVGSAREKEERARSAVDALVVEKRVGRAFWLGAEPCPRARIAALDGDVRAGARTLLQDVHVVLPRGARVLVEGDNGAGKTTLLRALVDAARLPAGRAFVLQQELSVDDERAALHDVRTLPHDVRGRTLQLVAALGVDPVRLLQSAHPSSGEAKKLLLARALVGGAWACFLDEPSNHLDLPSLERLSAALAEWPGALVVVSHDRRFARACAVDLVWRVGEGRVDVSRMDDSTYNHGTMIRHMKK